MLKEMKLVLGLLNETEKNVIREFKGDALDQLTKVGRLGESFRELQDKIAIECFKFFPSILSLI